MQSLVIIILINQLIYRGVTLHIFNPRPNIMNNVNVLNLELFLC